LSLFFIFYEEKAALLFQDEAICIVDTKHGPVNSKRSSSGLSEKYVEVPLVNTFAHEFRYSRI
jgi:hypothetical protein